MCTCIDICVQLHTAIYMYIYICRYMYTACIYIYRYMYTAICISIYKCRYMYAVISMYRYLYRYTCTASYCFMRIHDMTYTITIYNILHAI